MSSFKELKNRLSLEQKPKLEETSTPIEEPQLPVFELEEARYMLNLIANSDFKGRDVQTVYNIAIKLQDIVQEINN